MMKLIILAALTFGAIEGVLQGPLVDFYRELGCVPLYENAAASPTSYDCSTHNTRDLQKCHFQGKAYSVEALGDLEPCSKSCFCHKDTPSSPPTITCAHVECPELVFGRKPPPGCYFAYTHDKCCTVKTICPDQERIAPATCSNGGKVYKAGQQFYPKEAPCKVCICGENYQGKFEEPFCKDIRCNTQLRSLERINQGCVPVYFGSNGCCPIQWKCPGERNDKVVAAKVKSRSSTTQTCKFGSLVLQPGDTLDDTTSVVHYKLDCVCKLPPFITCIARNVD